MEIFVFRLNTEAKLAVIWGLLITCGSKLLEANPNAREPLLLLARYLRNSSNTSDGWGEGILGAIGLKKETVSNKYVLGHLYIDRFFYNPAHLC